MKWYVSDMQRGPVNKKYTIKEIMYKIHANDGTQYERIEDFRAMLISPAGCGPTYLNGTSNFSDIRGTKS
jgi:hypothetical protein